MTTESTFPTSYQQWRHCIEVRCKITLSPDYIEGRLTELKDGKHPKTKEFAKLYGQDYLQQVIEWFTRAAEE